MGDGDIRTQWPLVGRQDELAIALRAVQRHCHVVLMGEPGVGKTRLAREVCDAWEAGGRVERIWATEAAAGIPLGAAAHLIPVDQLGDGRDGVLRAVGQILLRTRAAVPILMSVDDAHLLDDATATLVHQLATTDAVTVIATVRSGAPAPDAVTALWKDLDAMVVTLQPLARREVDELVGAVLGGMVDAVALDALWSASAGNALYLRELVGHGVETGVLRSEQGLWRMSGVPPSSDRLQALIGARMGALSDAEKEVLAMVALAEPMPRSCVSTLEVGLATEMLEDRGLVVSDRLRLQVSLAHPLMGEVAVSELSPGRLARVRSRLADVLEPLAGEDPTARFRVALLRADAGDGARPELWCNAAQHALAWWDGVTAERLARAALASGWEPRAGHLLAEALAAQGRTAEAVEVWERIESLDAPAQLLASIAIGHASLLHFHFGNRAAAREVLDRMRSRLTDFDAIRVIDDTLRVFEGAGGRVAEDSSGSDRTPVGSLAGALSSAVRGELGRSRQIIQCALVDVDRWREEYPSIELYLRQIDALAAVLSGNLDTAEIERRYTAAVDERADFVRAGWCVLRSWVRVLRGHAQTALDAAREGLAVSGSTDRGWNRPLHAYAAMACTLLGDLPAADSHVARAVTANPGFDEVFGADVERARSWVFVAQGETSAACATLRTTIAHAQETTNCVAELVALHDLARFGEPAAGRMTELASRVDGELARALAGHVCAMVARDGDGLDRVAATLGEIGLDLHAAEASALASQAHRAGGHRAPAYFAEARSREFASRCGPVRTPTLVWHDRPGDLTTREREVAELVASGMPSRDVGDRLGISTRTVDNLLGRVYVKLDIANRRQLAELFDPVRHPQIDPRTVGSKP